MSKKPTLNLDVLAGLLWCTQVYTKFAREIKENP